MNNIWYATTAILIAALIVVPLRRHIDRLLDD